MHFALFFSYLLQIVRHLLGGRGEGCLHRLHSRSPLRTACPRCMLANCIVYRYICIHSATHKTTTITSTSHWHLSFTLRLKNHWNNNINNCMCVWFCMRLCVCVFCLVDGFFSVYLTVFALHSASASTSTRAQVSTATAIELSHERVKCGLGLRFRRLFLYLITFHLAANEAFANLYFELATSIFVIDSFIL